MAWEKMNCGRGQAGAGRRAQAGGRGQAGAGRRGQAGAGVHNVPAHMPGRAQAQAQAGAGTGADRCPGAHIMPRRAQACPGASGSVPVCVA